MARKKSKNIRERGKLRLSEYLKEIIEGQRVSIVQEKSVQGNFPLRVVGLTGTIVGEQGKFKIVELNDGNKTKRFIIHPIHLKILK